MDTNTGTPPNEGTGAPRDGDPDEGAEGSRNANDDAARNGQSDDGDDLEKVDDPARLREMLREMRKGERRRNEGYNALRETHRQTAERLAAIERERQAGAPLEERVKQLEKDLADERAKNTRMEQERKDEKTDAGIMAAARRLNAADPEDVARLLDRDDLTVEDDGTPTNAEAIVRAFLKKKPHLVKAGGGSGGADGGQRGSSGRGDGSDMNNLLRQASRQRRASSTAND
jgi:hypothetical protein